MRLWNTIISSIVHGREMKAISRFNKTLSSRCDWREANRFSRFSHVFATSLLLSPLTASTVPPFFTPHTFLQSFLFHIMSVYGALCDNTMGALENIVVAYMIQHTCVCAVESSFHHRVIAHRIGNDAPNRRKLVVWNIRWR